MDANADFLSQIRKIVNVFLQEEIGINPENVTDNMFLDSDLHLCRLDIAGLCVKLEDTLFIKFYEWPKDNISLGEFIQKVAATTLADEL